jgi:hypothetical protein
MNQLFSFFRNASKEYLLFFFLISLLSLYSLYIGKNNSIFANETVPIFERYSRIPKGLFSILTQKIGLPIILFVITLNIFILKKKFQNEEIKSTLSFFYWVGIFSIIYILLLPLGGYKEYRPNILRYDTFMPITIGLIFVYSKSSFILLKNIKGKGKYFYTLLTIICTFIFTNADKPEFNKNYCEKLSLLKISQSTNKIVFIENDCNILSWEKITDPKKSYLNGRLLKKWNITNEVKLYYQSQ